MKVWLVLETADYQTEYVFAARDLAEQFVEREGAFSFGKMKYAVEEVEVLDALPPPRV